ncbi:formate dehydrogenase subunit delta [Paracoccus sp. YLB-12]|uniref:Formate dehydrogenase subunit delta n=1 Tax=Paracoccus maritimus TaxID=2933292 RepID=A0ABT2K7H6_9RHOB|nr:formate dehydrogenase subunit delta [Paracoccus sp. YLB-12]MCT4332484.1 formate dehydrogenase subunit delta [Paracoccus sp. YLB-12]
MSPEKMVMMANQIASFFDSQPGDAADKVADHLRDFWEPRMRTQLLQYIEAGGGGLKPSVEEAARRL